MRQAHQPIFNAGSRILVVLVLLCGALTLSSSTTARAQGGEPLGPESHPRAIRDALSLAVTKGLQRQRLPSRLDFHSQSRDAWWVRFQCSAWWDESKARICPLGDRQATRTVVLAGDSHAGMWLYSLDELGKQQGFKVIPLLKHACSPYYFPQKMRGAPFPVCAKFRSWTRVQIRSLKPDAVILGSRGFRQVRPPRGTTVAQAWSAGVRATVRALRPYTRQVITLSDIPRRQRDVAPCVRQPKAHLGTCLAQARGSTETRSNATTMRASRSAGGRYVNVVPLLCQRDRCPVLVGRTFTYFDDDHLSLSWSRVVARALGTRLGPLVPQPPSTPAPS